MKNLENVTLVIVDTKNYGNAIASLQKSLQQIKPGRCIFFTDIEIPLPDGVELIKIDPIQSKEDYSHFIVKELYKYINTEYVLITQWDAWVLNGDAFDDEIINGGYEYIGAPWNYLEGYNVGNGGISLRSRRLMAILGDDPEIRITHPEDEITGRLYRRYLEKRYAVEFAPEGMAEKFSFELREPIQQTFGFHGFFHEPFKPHIVIKREGAMGDVIMCEPIIQYYHDKGYQVVLDTQPQFMSLFFNHPFRVKHISEMNPKIIPEKVVNLDMAYEIAPKQLVLDAYCKMAGITDMKNRNSKLYVNSPKQDALFSKYAIIHIDDTGMEYRNEHMTALEWRNVIFELQKNEYEVFQIGKRTKKQVTTHINTPGLEFLMYVISGADLFIGIDSGNAQLAVALGVPSVILFGSVNPAYRYADFSKIKPVHTYCPINQQKFCYHEVTGSTVGKACEIDEKYPPCTMYSAPQIINAINKLI